MNIDATIALIRDLLGPIDQAAVDLEGADPEFQLRDSHTALADAADALRADLARLESGDID